jgi:transmembrane sensor
LADRHVYRNEGLGIRAVSLADGSFINLNPNSEIRLRWTATERRVELSRGRARFQVSKDARRPFLVDTALGTVRAVGTIFDVDAQREATRVTVIEGHVTVEERAPVLAPAAQQPTAGGLSTADDGQGVIQLSPGDHATISDNDRSGSGRTAQSITAWTDQRVIFRGATLAEVVDEFNRYQGRPVIIGDTQLAPIIINGVFDPRQPDSLVTYLKLYEGVRTERSADDSLLLYRRPPGTGAFGTAEEQVP